MAFTVSVSSSKIDVLSGTGEFSDLYTAVIAIDASAMTNPSAGNYTIEGTRELEFSSGVVFNDNGNYEDGSLVWTSPSNGTGIDVSNGSSFTCTSPGFTFNLDADNGNYRYWYIYGNCTLTGTQAKPIIIKRYYAQRIFSYGQTIDFDYVDFQDPSTYSSSNYAIWIDQSPLYQFPETGDWSFTNITLSNRTNTGYIIRAYPGDWSKVVFDNWDTTDTRYGMRGDGGAIKITNSTFKNIYYYSLIYPFGTNDYYHASYGIDINKDLFQKKWTFDTCTFQDNGDSSSTEYGARLQYCGVVIKYKNCTFIGVDDAMSYGLEGYYNSRILLEGGQAGQTFTNVTNNVLYSSYRSYYDVYSFDLTVNDSGGTPLEDATVIVRQKESHEFHSFQTDSSGNIKDLYGDLPVFAYRENYSNSSTFDVWSDGTGNQTHVIEIIKKGYGTHTEEMNFTENKTLSVNLVEDSTANTLYGTTLYGSTMQ